MDAAGDHSYETGDCVTLAGVSNGVYNGTYTITKIDNNTYTYKLPSRPANNEGAPRGTGSFSSGGCPAGQGMVAIQEQRKDESAVSTTSIETTTTSSAMFREVATTGTVTPKTITTVVVDGVPTVTEPTTVPSRPFPSPSRPTRSSSRNLRVRQSTRGHRWNERHSGLDRCGAGHL